MVSETAFQRRTTVTARPGPTAGEMHLVRRVALGDERAFEELYRQHHARLTRFLSGLMRRPELVEEVLNDTMMTLWRSPESFNGASKLSTWLFTIAHRKALRARSRWDVPVEDDALEQSPTEEAGPHEQLDGRERSKLLVKAMGALSSDHRIIVELTYFNELGYEEISNIVGCPVGTVKTRMFHARRNLKAALPGGLADWL